MRGRVPLKASTPFLLLPLLFALGLPLAPAAVGTTTTQIAPMPADGDVTSVQVSPDGDWVLYTTEGVSSPANEAWTVKLEQGATPTLLSRASDGALMDVSGERFSRDGTQVFFAGLRYEEEPVARALYRVSVDGRTPPVRLSEIAVLSGTTETPDGMHLVYEQGDRIWAVSTTASSVSPTLVANGWYVIGATDTTVVYIVDGFLYRAPITGPDSAKVRLSSTAGTVDEAWLTPDGGHVVFTEDPAGGWDLDLFSVPTGGTAAQIVQLNDPFAGDYGLEEVTISANGARVLYLSATSQVNDPAPLYSVPVGGGAAVQLNGGLGGDAIVSRWTTATPPDGSRAVFAARATNTGAPKVVSVPIGGPAGAAVEIGAAHAANEDVWNVKVSPDGSRVVYTVAPRFESAWSGLFSAPLDGSSPAVVLKGAFPYTDNTRLDHSFAGDAPDVLFAPGADLYRVPMAGPASSAVRLNASGLVMYWDATPDGAIVVFAADQDSDEVYELYAVGELPPPTVPLPEEGVSRLAGDDRYATAVAISKATFATADVAYVAVGTNFPDALSGGPAAALGGGPILLTQTNALPQVTIDELARLQPSRIVVLGGPVAVSDGVVDVLRGYAPDVDRVAGGDRYATAAMISQDAFASADVAYVAVGTNFPDALAGGPAAALGGGPILLTQTNALPQVTIDELTRLQPARIVVLGGPVAITDAVVEQLQGHAAVVERVAGADRYATAAQISMATFSLGATAAYVAVGTNFPDALAGGPAAAIVGGPILLTQTHSLPQPTVAELSTLGLTRILVLGGPVAISDPVVAQLENYVE